MKLANICIMRYYIMFITLLVFSTSGTQLYGSAADSLFQLSLKEQDPKARADRYLEFLNVLASSDRDSATALLVKSIDEYRTSNFEYGLGRALSLHAWFLMYKSSYEEGMRAARKALSIQTTIHDSLGIALTLNRLGLLNMNFQRFEDASRYINTAYQYFAKINDSSRMDMTLNNLGSIATSRQLHQQAISYYQKSLAIRQARKSSYWVGYALYNIGVSFLSLSQTDSASYYLEKAYHTFKYETEAGKIPPMVILGMADLYLQQKHIPKALEFAKTGLQEAIQKNHTELVLEGKSLYSKILFAAGRFKEAYETQGEYLQLKSSIDSSNNAANVAEIEERYKNAEKEAEIAHLQHQNLKSESDLQRMRLLLAGGVISLVLVIVILILKWQQRLQHDKLVKADLGKKIAEARMFALRAQMNPHFIFNCINTAQHFVTHNKTQQAYEYLSDFAALLRLVLENSTNTFNPVENEIEQIRLYTELEAVRFNNKFTVALHADEELQQGIYEIPGMMIQPLVENAIIHGLGNRTEPGGELQIDITRNGETLICNITDNGVGRAAAATIKAQKNFRYRSAAIPNITERLNMLRNVQGISAELTVEDLNKNGVAAGTKVTLTLPLR